MGVSMINHPAIGVPPSANSMGGCVAPQISHGQMSDKSGKVNSRWSNKSEFKRLFWETCRIFLVSTRIAPKKVRPCTSGPPSLTCWPWLFRPQSMGCFSYVQPMDFDTKKKTSLSNFQTSWACVCPFSEAKCAYVYSGVDISLNCSTIKKTSPTWLMMAALASRPPAGANA